MDSFAQNGSPSTQNHQFMFNGPSTPSQQHAHGWNQSSSAAQGQLAGTPARAQFSSPSNDNHEIDPPPLFEMCRRDNSDEEVEQINQFANSVSFQAGLNDAEASWLLGFSKVRLTSYLLSSQSHDHTRFLDWGQGRAI